MIEPRADRPHVITVGADKAYDAEEFVNEPRSMRASPHVVQNTTDARRRSRAAPPDTPDTPSASASANGSKKPSAG
jgi:hypothetical protein